MAIIDRDRPECCHGKDIGVDETQASTQVSQVIGKMECCPMLKKFGVYKVERTTQDI